MYPFINWFCPPKHNRSVSEVMANAGSCARHRDWGKLLGRGDARRGGQVCQIEHKRRLPLIQHGLGSLAGKQPRDSVFTTRCIPLPLSRMTPWYTLLRLLTLAGCFAFSLCSDKEGLRPLNTDGFVNSLDGFWQAGVSSTLVWYASLLSHLFSLSQISYR